MGLVHEPVEQHIANLEARLAKSEEERMQAITEAAEARGARDFLKDELNKSAAALQAAETHLRELRQNLAQEQSVQRLNDCELSTVLAALRFWQGAIQTDTTGDKIFTADEDEQINATGLMPEQFEDEAPLTCAEIDDLCERLNS
jgi:chromosome segregation ATPase